MADVLGILIHLGKGVDIVPKVSDDDLIYIASHIGRIAIHKFLIINDTAF